jgi:hypothetical protein
MVTHLSKNRSVRRKTCTSTVYFKCYRLSFIFTFKKVHLALKQERIAASNIPKTKE